MRAIALGVVLASGVAVAANDGGFQDVMGQLAQICAADPTAKACEKYCPTDGGPDFCRFSDEVLADVAVVVAAKEATTLRNEVGKALAAKDTSKKALGVPAPPDLAVEAGTVLTDIATRLIQGLALVIADRAQREAAAFALEQLYTGLCSGDLRIWFRSTCSLADPGDGGLNLQAYGSGAPAVQLLRSALEKDVRAFPGIASREVLLAMIAADQREFAGAHYTVLPDDAGYSGNGKTWAIGMPSSFGAAVESAATDLEQGIWFFDAIRPVTAEIDRANATAQTDGRVLAPRSQYAACALAVPGGLLGAARSSAFAQLRGAARTRAWLLTTLMQATPCQTLLKQAQALEELLIIDSATAPMIYAVDQGVYRLVTELARYAAMQAQRSQVDGGLGEPPPISDVMAASLRVSRAALQLSSTTISALSPLCAAIVEPYNTALCAGVGFTGPVTHVLEIASRQLELADAVLQRDWSSVAVGTTRMAFDFCNADPVCHARVPKVQGQLNGAIALISAKTSDDAAKVIDSLADPIGEWRGKLEDGRFTVSFTSHAGVLAGYEFRWGQYGVFHERGGGYPSAPTLTLPVGLELAWGFGRAGFSALIPLLDPFAFLQYDATRDGRLPGARLLTVLAPGLHLRASFGRTPFGIDLFGVYRPGFRSFESGLNVTGANVAQFGLELTVDVTLFAWVRRP